MPKSRGSSEMPQRQSPRGSHTLRTSSTSDSVGATTDRSPKVSDHRRSPRGGPHSDPPVQQKKLGTRIADLESQLGQAQQELKSLKEQLASAEAAKNEAQKELESKSSKKPTQPNPQPDEVAGGEEEEAVLAPEDNDREETDVFEVPAVEIKKDAPNPPSPEVEMALKKHEEEMKELRAKQEEMEKELLVSNQEKEELRKQLNEAAARIECSKAKEEETRSRLSRLEEEVEASRGNAAELECQLEAVKEGKDMLECEMKRMRVQTEQWRKAADAAAAVLAGGNGRFVSDQRCASMEKPFGGGSMFETPAGGYGAGYAGSPGFGDDMDEGYGSGGKQRKGSSGIKMFGDLWKRKTQK
ncbi:unnamed protein product [Linum tenue]|uniref:Uncharacterized protein n=1 Tax=Linum tenue TaxID=586396 RepID=A0AAV0M467_9ROSI|nr:unnamed protein product [Linum tenue]